jgi:DNA (cytosine-5)-methyltransferase 3A
MKYISLFSGIGGFEQAIHAVFPDAECVGYSEINPYSISIYKTHFPNHPALGDVTKINPSELPDIDMLVFGSPCTDLSIAKQGREGLKGEQSKLFYNALEIMRVKKPKYVIMENVESMSDESRDAITKELGFPPIMINSALVSAQTRKRYFWCNFKVNLPEDRHIYLKDILEEDVDEKYFLDEKTIYEKQGLKKIRLVNPSNKAERIGEIYPGQAGRIYSTEGKSVCLNANGGGLGAKTGMYLVDKPDRVGEVGTGYQGARIYSENGKSIALSATSGGGKGSKTGLYAVGCAKRKRGELGKLLEMRKDDKSNSLTTIQTDSMVIEKMGTLTEAFGRGGSSKEFLTMVRNMEEVCGSVRKLTPVECERLQSFPDYWTSTGINEKGEEVVISDSQRYRALGNAVNMEVVKHIMTCITNQDKITDMRVGIETKEEELF